MATAQDIITRAYKTARILGEGETPTDAMISDGLVYLNDLIQDLSNQRLMIWETTQETITCDGSTSYSIGSGGDKDTVRPLKLTNVFFRYNGTNVDTDVQVITKDEYDSIVDKTSTSDALDYVYLSTDFPLAYLYVYPVASNGTIYFTSWKPITEFSSRTTTVSLPPGYERMLRYNLAVEIMPEFGRSDPMVLQQAVESKANIKRVNSKRVVSALGLPVYGINSSNIQRGY